MSLYCLLWCLPEDAIFGSIFQVSSSQPLVLHWQMNVCRRGCKPSLELHFDVYT